MKNLNLSKKYAIPLLGVVLILLSIPITAFFSRETRNPASRAADPTFQPTAPYHATFFYPWYKNPDTDFAWGHWEGGGHNPPQNWDANYLPDPEPNVFDPANELYSSFNQPIINWQLQKMAQARIEVAISSWWGQGDVTDLAFSNIIKNVMNAPENPYPNLRWALYYEKEAGSDPSVSEIVNDLNYIQNQYGDQPGMLKINGKPVVFVYSAGIDGPGMVSRWEQVRSQTNFYINLQVFPGFGTYASKADSWHQYNPTLRGESHAPYSTFVSPGFWKVGESAVLSRNLDEFRTAVSLMVNNNTTWKLVETWNEWHEGTSVEPGDQVIQTLSGSASLHPSGVPFKNQYVDILKDVLPTLENGTGGPKAWGTWVGNSIQTIAKAGGAQDSSTTSGDFVFTRDDTPVSDGIIYQIAVHTAPDGMELRINHAWKGAESFSISDWSCDRTAAEIQYKCPREDEGVGVDTTWEEQLVDIENYISTSFDSEAGGNVSKISFIMSGKWEHDNVYSNEVKLKNVNTGQFETIYRREFLNRTGVSDVGSAGNRLEFFIEDLSSGYPSFKRTGFMNLHSTITKNGETIETDFEPTYFGLGNPFIMPYEINTIAQNGSWVMSHEDLIILGDLNGDGKVNIIDASILTANWGTSDATSDLNNDGVVNIIDASILTSNWTG